MQNNRPHHPTRHPRPPRPINSALGDQLAVLTFSSLFPDANPENNHVVQGFRNQRPDPHHKPAQRRSVQLYAAPPEPTIRNYVKVTYKGKGVWHPIHAWMPVVELCERLYQRCNATRVRGMSRRAIGNVVQQYLDRQGIGLIPRSVIEASVRNELAREFPSPKESSHVAAGSGIKYPADKPRQSYEERIRLYRAKKQAHQQAQSGALTRFEMYLAEKKSRFVGEVLHSLPNSFTDKSGDSRTVWIGLDFGTRNIKAMFRDAEEDDRSVALEFSGDRNGIERFMFSPSLVISGRDVSFVRDAEKPEPSWKHTLSFLFGHSFTSMDDRVLEWLTQAKAAEPSLADLSLEDLAVFFSSLHLAWVLHAVGEQVRSAYKGYGYSKKLAFRVFMCAPAAVMDDQLGQVVFQDCLTQADQLHGRLDFSQNKLPLREAAAAFHEVRRLGVLLEPRLRRRSRVVPEVIAEIASYAHSRAAREGVYALVDVGAGTADLNIFRIVASTNEAGIRTPVYAASCNPHGILHLESLLAPGLAVTAANGIAAIEAQKRSGTFLDASALAQQAPDPGETHASLIRGFDAYATSLTEKTSSTWRQAFLKKGMESWDHLTLFLCGGGAGLQGMKDRLKSGIPDELLHVVSTAILPCPGADEFVRPAEFPEDQFHRVAVAYGLTQGSDFDDAGTTILPGGISPLLLIRETADIEERFISKDMV